MKFRRLAMTVGAVGAAAVLLAGCGATSTATQAALQKANEIVMPQQSGSPVNSFFPILPGSAYSVANSQATMMTYAPLVMVSSSDTVDMTDSLLQSFTASNNDQTFTVTIKPWKWSDGTNVTAGDVAWTANLMIQSCTMKTPPFAYGGCGFGGLAASGSGHASWKTVVATGPNTVVFTTDMPANPNWFELNALGQIVPVPQHVWDIGNGDWTADLTNINKIYNTPTSPEFKVVDGPYTFSKEVPNQYQEWVPNPKYSGTQKATATIILQQVASDAARFADMKTGKINLAALPTSLFSSQGQLKGLFNSLKIVHGGFCMWGMILNWANNQYVGTAMADKNVRAALEMALDKNALGLIGASGHQGWYGVMDSAIPPVPVALVNSVFGVTSIADPYPYNPTAAIALLKSDGYSLVGGVMTKGNVKLAFPYDYESGSSEQQNVAVLVQKDWAAIGVQATPRPLPFNQLISQDSDFPSGQPTKWVVNDYGGWCYEPNFYPTGYGMWGYYGGSDGMSDPALNAAVAATYLPGTAQQSQQRMLAYANATATELPMLWTNYNYDNVQVAPYIQGFTAGNNLVEAFEMWNYLSITH